VKKNFIGWAVIKYFIGQYVFVKKNFIGWAVIKYFIGQYVYGLSPYFREKMQRLNVVIFCSCTGEEVPTRGPRQGEEPLLTLQLGRVGYGAKTRIFYCRPLLLYRVELGNLHFFFLRRKKKDCGTRGRKFTYKF
jgi:hypothetical protein